MSFIPLGEEIEEHWADNDNVAIIDFLDSIDQPYSCAQWGSIENSNLPTIIDDGKDYNFQNEFHDIYPTNVFIDHEMQVHAILDTAMVSVESVNEKIQEMLDDLPADLAIDNNNYAQIPYYFEITDVYPNPFNPVLNININIAWAAVTQVNILDIAGKHINTIHFGYLQPGSHEIRWNGESLPSGVYFVSVTSGEKKLTEKVVLLK